MASISWPTLQMALFVISHKFCGFFFCHPTQRRTQIATLSVTLLQLWAARGTHITHITHDTLLVKLF